MNSLLLYTVRSLALQRKRNGRRQSFGEDQEAVLFVPPIDPRLAEGLERERQADVLRSADPLLYRELNRKRQADLERSAAEDAQPGVQISRLREIMRHSYRWFTRRKPAS